MPHCVCFRRLATILFLALGAVGTSFPLARAQGPGSFTLTDSDAGELRETLKKQASDNPMMRGAWTTIEETKDSDDVVSAMTVTAYIDDGRAGDQQLEAILSVLNQSVIKDFKYELKKKRLPVKRLIDQLNSDAELNPRVAGVNIESAYFGPDSDPRKALKLQLTGTSSAPDGRARMEEAARSTAQRLFVNSPVKVDVDAAGVRSVPAQEGIRDAGPRCFAEGVARYRRCDFDGAYQSFTSATKHAPGQVDYQYWRVVSLLAVGRETEATTLLGNLIEQRKSAYMEQGAAQSLELVQGPVRQRMREIEQSLVCGSAKTGSVDGKTPDSAVPPEPTAKAVPEPLARR